MLLLLLLLLLQVLVPRPPPPPLPSRLSALVLMSLLQVVGAFLESGTPEEFAAIKQAAVDQPAAPALADLGPLGLSFAVSRM